MQIPPHEQVQAVVRGLTTIERDGQQMRLLRAERTYPAEVGEVWDALTNQERIARWLGGGISGDLTLGGRYKIEGNAEGEVLGCTPPSRLSLTWEYGGEVSWVDVTLSTVDDQTHLLLEHTASVPPEFWDQFGPGAVGIGWDLTMLGLHEHLLSPDAEPAETRLERPEGREYYVDFVTGSSEGWTRASLAAGTDPDAARAAGARATEAYTATPEA